jgi:hypothetical protein
MPRSIEPNAPWAPGAATHWHLRRNSSSNAGAASTTRRPRPGTKQVRLIEMLRAAEGVTIAEIVTALDWQPHTARGACPGH